MVVEDFVAVGGGAGVAVVVGATAGAFNCFKLVCYRNRALF